MSTDEDPRRLKLRAEDLDDLSVISTLVQDALVPLGDIAYLPDEKSFVMALNRFRWGAVQRGKARERVNAVLRFDAVNGIRYRRIDRRDRGGFLSLLTVAHDSGVFVLHFSGGGAIRLEADGLHCVLTDMDEPWPTRWTPGHEDADA